MSKPVCEKVNPLIHTGYRGSDGAVTCCLCDCEMEWEDCSAFAGDGGFDGYEEDPLWYEPGEIAPCSQCRSRGGDYWCETKDCPTITAIRIFKEKPSSAPTA